MSSLPVCVCVCVSLCVCVCLCVCECVCVCVSNKPEGYKLVDCTCMLAANVAANQVG